MHFSKQTRFWIWATVSLSLVTLVAIGILARQGAQGLQSLESASVSWPENEKELSLPGRPSPLRFILWGNGEKSLSACNVAAEATDSHILQRFKNASARRMHLSKKKGHEFLLADSEKILRFYSNIGLEVKESNLNWSSLDRVTAESILKIIDSQNFQLSDSCLFLIVDEVNVMQASILMPNPLNVNVEYEKGLIKRALSRSIHQWSTFRFLADVPMLRKQLTDPNYKH
jgi:hypothetical protein